MGAKQGARGVSLLRVVPQRGSIGQGMFRSEAEGDFSVGRDDRRTELTQRNRTERERKLAGLYFDGPLVFPAVNDYQ